MSSVELPVLVPPSSLPTPPHDREALVRRARLLAWLGICWHAIEAAIAIAAGLAASSIALVGFGADSLIESLAGFVVAWRFARPRATSDAAERTAQRLIGASFFLLAAYVGIESVRTLLGGDHPRTSWVGIGLAAFTLATMPLLATAKSRLGDRLQSSATKSEGRQNMLCAYLSAALILGLGGNAAFGLWWLDPVVALFIAGVALREGRQAWRGDACGCETCCT